MEFEHKSANRKKHTVILLSLLETMKVAEKGLSPTDRQILWNKTMHEIQVSPIRKPQKKWLRKITTASASIALILCGYCLYDWNPSMDQPADSLSQIEQKGPTQQTDQIRLITAEKEWEINGDKAELVYEKNGAILLNEEKVAQDKSQRNQLIVPQGKTSSVILSDGTKVWLNSGTKLLYPAVFSTNEREIYVEGEIYLEVAKDESHPFRVKTNQMEITVLGTSFNVQAYTNETKQSVVLASGIVDIQNQHLGNSIRMHPNQLYSYDTKSKDACVKDVDAYDYSCWRYGFFHFKSEQLAVVLNRLQYHYNIPIRFNESDLDKIRVSGKLDLQKGIAESLQSISLTTRISYTIERDQITIHVKQN